MSIGNYCKNVNYNRWDTIKHLTFHCYFMLYIEQLIVRCDLFSYYIKKYTFWFIVNARHKSKLSYRVSRLNKFVLFFFPFYSYKYIINKQT